MNKDSQESAAKHLEDFAQQVREGKVDWYAITVKYPRSRIALHTKGAPDRPRGLS